MPESGGPLSNLLIDTAALLNDQNYSFISQNQLLRWVNRARRECAFRTGCVRRLITGQSAFGASAQPGFFVPGAGQPGALPNPYPAGTQPFGSPGAVQNRCATIPSVERYPYTGFFNNFLRAQYPGCKGVMDSIQIAVNWGGVSRPALDWQPWDDFQAYCRAYAVLNTSYPSVWSVYNDGPMGEIWMFPIPSVVGEMELDAFCYPEDVNTDSDPEVIPSTFYDALAYGGAKIAFLSSQRYAQAQAMESQFADMMGVSRVAVDRGKSTSYYDTRL